MFILHEFLLEPELQNRFWDPDPVPVPKNFFNRKSSETTKIEFLSKNLKKSEKINSGSSSGSWNRNWNRNWIFAVSYDFQLIINFWTFFDVFRRKKIFGTGTKTGSHGMEPELEPIEPEPTLLLTHV